MPLDTHKQGKDWHSESWGGIGCAGRWDKAHGLSNRFCPCLVAVESHWPSEPQVPRLFLPRTCSNSCGPPWAPFPLHLVPHTLHPVPIVSPPQCPSCLPYLLAPTTHFPPHPSHHEEAEFHSPDLLLNFWNYPSLQVSYPISFPSCLFFSNAFRQNLFCSEGNKNKVALNTWFDLSVLTGVYTF